MRISLLSTQFVQFHSLFSLRFLRFVEPSAAHTFLISHNPCSYRISHSEPGASRRPSFCVSRLTNGLQLVSELRTRLSYALIKVNKGWEDLPINEVESRTSQAGSPTSSTSTPQGRRTLITSPRTAIV